MQVGTARAVAAGWVARHTGPGFRGAVLTGSVGALPPTATSPPTSDVDIVVVVEGEASPKIGKVLVDGVLLDVSFVPEADLRAAATSWVWAPSFRGGQVLADPTGLLGRIEAEIAPTYATPEAAAARAEDVRRTIRARLRALDPGAPWPVLVTSWLFPATLTAVVAVVAAGGTPTVRLRCLRAREVLSPADHEVLLGLLGCAGVAAPTVARHLDALESRFVEAGARLRTPFPFAGDLRPDARPVAVDGSRALVAAGDHREAVFWVVATAARCQQVLAADDPELAARREPGFRELVADLTGLRDAAGVLARRDDVLATIECFPSSAVSAR